MAHFPTDGAPAPAPLAWPHAGNPALALPYPGPKALLAPRSPGAAAAQPSSALYEALPPLLHAGTGHGSCSGLGSPEPAGRSPAPSGLGHGLPLLVPPVTGGPYGPYQGAPLGAAPSPAASAASAAAAAAAAARQALAGAAKGRGWPAVADASPGARRSRRRRQGS